MFTFAGCGGQPAVCSDADSLKSSISALGEVQFEKGALPELKDKWKTVTQDFSKLESSAKSEFGSELGAVRSATTSFKASLDAAVANPTATTLAAARAALQPLKTALSNLSSAIEKTC
jgi:hypothetical protein